MMETAFICIALIVFAGYIMKRSFDLDIVQLKNKTLVEIERIKQSEGVGLREEIILLKKSIFDLNRRIDEVKSLL